MLKKAVAEPRALNVSELSKLVSLSDEGAIREMRSAAYELKCRYCGKVVSMRGIIELGNICAKDCFYCGIRKSNSKVQRYQLSLEDVEKLARINYEDDYASIVLQSGEIEGAAHTEFIEECIKRIIAIAPPGKEPLGITLSLGEQTQEVFRRWKEAGAARYLLRVETSNRELYAKLHPGSHDFERRVECLRMLRRCGYQVGTGVMSCLPGQTSLDLANDIRFFGDIDADMIGMGPYIPHNDTPLGKSAPHVENHERLRLGLNMISAARLYLHDVNIASTTALQALADDGREQGILAGANVMMPNITDTKYRSSYQLYENKPCLDENAEQTRRSLEQRLRAIGETINYGKRGDSVHFLSRTT